ncbi:MAG: hypothetical protein U0T82_03120 [Bacteroidales bacterium]
MEIHRTRRFIYLVIFLLPLINLSAQEQESAPRKFFFGGNFDLMFGTITSINISPLVGYRLTPRFSAGTGITYEYYREKITPSDIVQASIYGGRAFLSYDIIPDINKLTGLPMQGALMAYSEYEALNQYISQSRSQVWLNNIYIGGGWKIPVGERAAIQLLLLYNLNETLDSPNSNPLFRFGFIF